jgi:hypothetical protein
LRHHQRQRHQLHEQHRLHQRQLRRRRVLHDRLSDGRDLLLHRHVQHRCLRSSPQRHQLRRLPGL